LLVILLLLHQPTPTRTQCCPVLSIPLQSPSSCPSHPNATTYPLGICADCTPPQKIFLKYHCGRGDCNVFGCNCEGGCKGMMNTTIPEKVVKSAEAELSSLGKIIAGLFIIIVIYCCLYNGIYYFAP